MATSTSKKSCIYSAQGELRCCDSKDRTCYHDFLHPQQSTVADKTLLVEKFTKNAPFFTETNERGDAKFEPVGMTSGYVDQFANLSRS